MDPTRDERIGPTAHYTAYVWHRLGMPYGDLFATPKGARLFWSFRLAGEWMASASHRVPSMEQYLALRHRLIEAALEEQQPDRIVEIGAGLSRRGVTWAAEKAVPYVELDLPHMAAVKRELLVRRAPPELRRRLEGQLQIEEADILDPGFGARLAELLQGARRPAVIAEGVVGYFDMGERQHIVSSVRQGLGTSQGIFLCDLRTHAAGRALGPIVGGMRLAIRLVTRGRGIREDFADDADVRAFFARTGFARADKLDASRLADLAHLTFPSAVWRATAGASGKGTVD